MDEKIEYFVWRHGEKADRSSKFGDRIPDTEEKAKMIALEEKPLTRSDMDFSFSEFIKNSNTSDRENLRNRDEANNKLNMRYMVQQISQNPFLQKTNYIDDIETQEKFLRPKQSN
jgi:hypothetical protein